MKKTLNLVVVGGLGVMASPMARHWKKEGDVKVIRVHDRGNSGDKREQARNQWKLHGAELVNSYEALIGNGMFDGIVICAGKNADDAQIIRELTQVLSQISTPKPFICHLSTVSTGFAESAFHFCRKNKIRYANYPLTGGAVGAEKGTLLILASGEAALFETLKPALSFLGTPKFFGERVSSGAEVKFMGHLMVFNGLVGIASAAAVHSECFQKGAIGGAEQSEFFDFLNTGAGGTRQWEVSLGWGIRSNIWNSPFSVRYAAVDAIYTVELCRERKVSWLVQEAIINVALTFSYLLNHVGLELATQAIVRELVRSRSAELDYFLMKHSAPRGETALAIQKVIESLPKEVQKQVALSPSSLF